MTAEPRPIVSALVFVLGALLIGAGLHWTSETLAPVYRPQKLRIQLLERVAADVEIINAGNSLNRAIDYHHMDLRGFHLWDGGADLLDASYALRIITPMLPNLKVVFVPLNPLSFRTDKTLIGLDGLRRQYYAVMPSLASWRPLPGDAGNLIQGKLSSIVREDHWEQVFRAAFAAENARAPRRPVQEVDETGYFGPYLSRTISPDRQRIEELEGFFREAERSVRANPTLPEKIYREFAAAIARIRARDIRVILILPPNLEAVNELFARRTTEMAELKEYLGRLRHDYGVEYLDFSSDAAFSNPDLFFTEDHLNKFGAAVFSRKLNDLLDLGQYAGHDLKSIPLNEAENHPIADGAPATPAEIESQARRWAQRSRNQLAGQQALDARVGAQPGAPVAGTGGAAANPGSPRRRREGPAGGSAVAAPPLPIEGWAVETREGNAATLVSQRVENWMRVTIDKLANRSASSIRLHKGPVAVTRDHRYVLKFWMSADAARPVTCGMASGADADKLLGASTKVEAGTWWQEFSCAFKSTATDANARIFFDLGTSQAALELSRVELRDLSTGTVVMSTDPAFKPSVARVR